MGNKEEVVEDDREVLDLFLDVESDHKVDLIVESEDSDPSVSENTQLEELVAFLDAEMEENIRDVGLQEDDLDPVVEDVSMLAKIIPEEESASAQEIINASVEEVVSTVAVPSVQREVMEVDSVEKVIFAKTSLDSASLVDSDVLKLSE